MRSVLEGGRTETDFWNSAMEGKISTKQWVHFLEGRGYRGGVDFPTSAFYKDIMEAYPNAKIILTVRDPKKWYWSVKNTIFIVSHLNRSFPTNLFLTIIGKKKWSDFADRLSRMPTNGIDHGKFDSIKKGEDAAVIFFNKWTDQVKKNVPEDKLLIFDVKEGWDPLCKFLDVPVPSNQPFPWENDTASIQKFFRRIILLSYLTIVGMPILLGLLFGWQNL